jgi:DNA-binding MarR family transcriptional regulator
MDLFKQSSETREDLGMLAVMDALAVEEQVTQRELSRQTGLNLKKVNYCLHKLLEKGYVKFQRAVNNPDKRVYLYILTPAGLKAKSQLTYGFLKFTLGFYNQVEDKLRFCLGKMARSGVDKIVLYGATDVAKVVLDLVEDGETAIVGVLDEGYAGSEFNGVQMVGKDALNELEWDGVLITALENLDEVGVKLRQMGIPEEKVWTLA